MRTTPLDLSNSSTLATPVEKSVNNFETLLTAGGPAGQVPDTATMRRHHLYLVALIAIHGCERQAPDTAPKKKIERVVSLTPSSTELVAAAGGLDRLVGVDRFSDHPPGVEKLPRVGDFLSPNLEAILELSPDLVVLDELQSKIGEALEAGGVRTLVLPMHSTADVKAGLEAIAGALGTEDRTGELVGRIESRMADVAARAKTRPADKPRVMVIVDRQLGALGSLVGAGPGTFLDELLTAAGATNALISASTRYPKLSPEQVLELQPTVVLDAVHTKDSARARRDWDGLEIPAVRRDRVHMLSDRIFISPGPRMAEALERVEKLVW